MTTSILRTADGWWVRTGGAATRIDTAAASTADLLAERAAIATAVASPDPVAVESLSLLSPVTAPCRVIAQMTNYASHARDAGMNPDTLPLTFFRKSSGSISGPADDIVAPGHVRLLDYEVEIGLVVGREMPVGSTVGPDGPAEFLAGLVLTNDVSARDVQLPQTQFYEAKSYPTFTPTGPALVLLEQADWARFAELRLRLWVNGAPRQNAVVGGDMLYPPAQALAALARFQRLSPGDLILTGTPAGTALRAPAKEIRQAMAAAPPERRWDVLFDHEDDNPDYLRDGDLVEATVGTDDGAVDLGRQSAVVRAG